MKQTAGEVKKQRKKWTIHKFLHTELWYLQTSSELFTVEGSKSFISRIARLLNEDDARKAKKRRKQ